MTTLFDDVPLIEVIVASLLCEGARQGELTRCYPGQQERFLHWARIELEHLAVRGIMLEARKHIQEIECVSSPPIMNKKASL
jgi:hypothetical protein